MTGVTQAADPQQPFAGAFLSEEGDADSALERVRAEMTKAALNVAGADEPVCSR